MPQLPGGLLVSGVLRAKRDGDFCRLTVEYEGRDREGNPVTRTRQVEYRGYSPSTGQPSRVAQALALVEEGDSVVVPVFPSVKPGGRTRDGREYGAFVVYDALDVIRAELLHDASV